MLHFFGPKGKHLQLLVRMECWRDSEDRGPFRPNYGVVIAIWRRKWQSTPIFLPGKFHGWRSLVGYSPQGCKESDTAERLHFLFTLSLTIFSSSLPLQIQVFLFVCFYFLLLSLEILYSFLKTQIQFSLLGKRAIISFSLISISVFKEILYFSCNCLILCLLSLRQRQKKNLQLLRT